MAFRIVYVDNGDVVAQLDSYEEAHRSLIAFLEEHPERDDEIGIQEIDKRGYPVGDLIVGLEVAGQQLQLR